MKGMLEGVSVMVVEDNPQVRTMMVRTLKRLGAESITAVENADGAREILEGGVSVKLLLSDIRMAGSMDGLGLARWVAQTRPEVRILLQTGFSNQENHEFPVLEKPYSLEELREAVRQLMLSP